MIASDDHRRVDGQANGLGVAGRRVLVCRDRAFAIVLRAAGGADGPAPGLRHLELLKTWPVKASAVVRGEMVWPGVAITGAGVVDARDRDRAVRPDA